MTYFNNIHKLNKARSVFTIPFKNDNERIKIIADLEVKMNKKYNRYDYKINLLDDYVMCEYPVFFKDGALIN